MATINLNVNGKKQTVDVDPKTPVLWVLRDHLNLVGTKFGCGIAQCGACTIHVDGAATRSCVLPVSSVENKEIVTIEGPSENGDHPVQKAWLELDVAQCGYCQAGQIMAAAALLESNPNPNDDEIENAMNGNICRCATYLRIKANYLAEGWTLPSNITIGAFRAPRSNFIAAAEQSFIDELAELAGKDPIDFRLDLLDRAKKNPVGKDNDYDPDRYAGVLRLVREKSNWAQTPANVSRGVAAYFCHNTYVAEVVDLKLDGNNPVIENVVAAVDCGIVVNPDAAKNMGEGGIIDGIGNALFGEMTFKAGVPDKNNFHQYRMIRQKESPKSVEVHFVKNEEDPTGLGEPLFPPVFAAVANALYKATGKRFYDQPFAKDIQTAPGKM